MTQSSTAVSADGSSWLVLNASPDIRVQLAGCAALAPEGLRGSPIEAVMLTNGDVDHVAGLLTLRESTAFDLYATAEIMEAVEENPIFGVMKPDLVARRRFALGDTLALAGLDVETYAVPGKVPLYKEAGEVVTDAVGETTIGVTLRAGGKTTVYVPGCAAIPDDLRARMENADLVLFDGTVWENEEMPKLGAGVKTGRRMGHVPIAGDDGSMARLAGLTARCVYIHINNTNPILQPTSAERDALTTAGWEVAMDGMEIAL